MKDGLKAKGDPSQDLQSVPKIVDVTCTFFSKTVITLVANIINGTWRQNKSLIVLIYLQYISYRFAYTVCEFIKTKHKTATMAAKNKTGLDVVFTVCFIAHPLTTIIL